MKLTKIEPPKIILSPKYSVDIIELFKNLGNVIVFLYYISSVKTICRCNNLSGSKRRVY